VTTAGHPSHWDMPPNRQGLGNCHPVCRRPAFQGADRRPGPRRQSHIDGRTTLAAPGGGLLGLPGSAAGGMARATTHHRNPHKSLAIPSRSRSAPAGGKSSSCYGP
jgi:hypothetical protein